MAIEIKEMVIRTSVDSSGRSTDVLPFGNLSQLKKEIIKECTESLKEHLERQMQR